MVPEEGDLATIYGGGPPPGGMQIKRPQAPAPTAPGPPLMIPAERMMQEKKDFAVNSMIRTPGAAGPAPAPEPVGPPQPDLGTQIAPFRQMMGDRRIADDRSMAGIGSSQTVLPNREELKYRRDDLQKQISHLAVARYSDPAAEEARLAQIGGLHRQLDREVNPLIQGQTPTLTPERARGDTLKFRAAEAGTAARDLPGLEEQFKAGTLTPADVAYRERLQTMGAASALPLPSAPTPEEEARIGESRRSGDRQNQRLSYADEQLRRRVGEERTAREFASSQGSGYRDLATATNQADVAAQRERGAASDFNSRPDFLTEMHQARLAELKGQTAKAQGETALSQAKTAQIQRGAAPEVINQNLEAEKAAMAGAKVDPNSIASDFARVLPTIKPRIGNGGFVDEFLAGTPRGSVGGSLSNLDTANQGADQLLRSIGPLEEADRLQPGTARQTARQLLDMLPAASENGEYGAQLTASPIPGTPQIPVFNGEGRVILSRKLTDLRKRLTKLLGSP